MRAPSRLAALLVVLGATSARADEPCPPPKPPPPCAPGTPAPAPPPVPAPKPESPPPAPKGEDATAKPAPEAAAEHEATVRARSAAVRAALPAPLKPWSFERDLVFDGFLLGKVTVHAEPASLGDQPVWYVVEKTVRQAGEGRVVGESSFFLAQDLSLLRGETSTNAPEGTEAMSFGRRDGKMEVTAEQGGKTRSATADVPADATFGLFAVLRFAEGVLGGEGRKADRFHLPVFEPRHAFGDGAGKPLPAGLADIALTLETNTMGSPSHLEAATRSGRKSVLVVDPASVFPQVKVGDVRGSFPSWDLVRDANGARRPDWFDRVGQTPLTAYQAFCSFGRGYHMAKRELIEGAFDWPSVHAHDVAAGTTKAETTVEELKEAYIAEFLRSSKHRTAADCDDLLTQVFVTSQITKDEANKTVSIQTLPAYGGHTFLLVERDGRWIITRID